MLKLKRKIHKIVTDFNISDLVLVLCKCSVPNSITAHKTAVQQGISIEMRILRTINRKSHNLALRSRKSLACKHFKWHTRCNWQNWRGIAFLITFYGECYELIVSNVRFFLSRKITNVFWWTFDFLNEADGV